MKPSTFNRRSIFLGLGLGAIVGCTKEEEKLAPEKIYELLSTTARGFPQHIDKVQLSQIFVMFDPQCPHCTKLWSETKAIKKFLLDSYISNTRKSAYFRCNPWCKRFSSHV